jgi:hypothetical protein
LSSTARRAEIIGGTGEPSVGADTIAVQPALALSVAYASLARSKWGERRALEIPTQPGRANGRSTISSTIDRVAEGRLPATSWLDAGKAAARRRIFVGRFRAGAGVTVGAGLADADRRKVGARALSAEA